MERSPLQRAPTTALVTLVARVTLVCLAVLGSAPAAAEAQLTVVYIANEGFLLEGAGRKVLIDALIDDGIRWYPQAPDAMKLALEQAQPPFDAVDLVLATHHHADHFGPRAVARHLTANSRARFVSTPQVIAKLRGMLADSVARRVEAVYPDEGARIHRRVRGIDLQVLNLHHGRGRNPPVQNLGFLLSIGGLKVLHIGDTEATKSDFAAYSLGAESIDVAFLPGWYLTTPVWIEVVRDEIRPAHIVVMHMAVPGAPATYFGRDGSYASRVEKIQGHFPTAIVFEDPGDSTTFALESSPAPADTGDDNGR